MGQNQPENAMLYRFRELAGKNIYSQGGDVRCGILDDLMIDPNLLEVAAIVTGQGKVLRRDMHRVPSIEVQAFGQDAILIGRSDEVRSLDEIPEPERFLSVVRHLIGAQVITTAGKRLGEIEDISIDKNGRVAGYDLKEIDQVRSPSYEGKTNYIPCIATHSLGEKLLIIDVRNLAWISD